VKYKFPVLALKAFRGNRSITPPILILTTTQRWLVNIMPQFIYPWERAPVPI